MAAEPPQRREPKRYQLPFLGGMLVGSGLGLLGAPVLTSVGFFEAWGLAGLLGPAFVVIMLGVAIGLPTRGP